MRIPHCIDNLIERPFLTAEWRWLVMLNWRVSPDLLARYVPRGTVLDSWHGDTWLSLVGFRFLNTRILGLPIPGHRHFPEINLRLYVRGADDRRAVMFIPALIRDGSDAQFIAEHYWGYTAQRDGSTVEYRVEHSAWRTWAVTDLTFDVDVDAEYGAEFVEVMDDPPASTFLADGSAVRVGWPRRF